MVAVNAAGVGRKQCGRAGTMRTAALTPGRRQGLLLPTPPGLRNGGRLCLDFSTARRPPTRLAPPPRPAAARPTLKPGPRLHFLQEPGREPRRVGPRLRPQGGGGRPPHARHLGRVQGQDRRGVDAQAGV